MGASAAGIFGGTHKKRQRVALKQRLFANVGLGFGVSSMQRSFKSFSTFRAAPSYNGMICAQFEHCSTFLTVSTTFLACGSGSGTSPCLRISLRALRINSYLRCTAADYQESSTWARNKTHSARFRPWKRRSRSSECDTARRTSACPPDRPLSVVIGCCRLLLVNTTLLQRAFWGREPARWQSKCDSST